MIIVAIYYNNHETSLTQEVVTDKGTMLHLRVVEITLPEDYNGDELNFAHDTSMDGETVLNTIEIEEKA